MRLKGRVGQLHWLALEEQALAFSAMLIIGGYLSWVANRFRKRLRRPAGGLGADHDVRGSAVLLRADATAANPFQPVGRAPPVDGPGPNPLLQNHILMAFHPPMLYLGYVGFTVPFAFAIAALVTGRVGEGWLVETRRGRCSPGAS